MLAAVSLPRAVFLTVMGTFIAALTAYGQERPRARDVGIEVGFLPPGPLNAITDVRGVRVGHQTVLLGDSIRTGVTAVLPHGGNLFSEKVRAAIVVRNGFGKLVGLSQVNELGQIETPILLTGTLSVFRVADALVDTLLQNPGNGEVVSINPVVGETNDGYLSDIRARPIQPEHVRAALRSATDGPVAEGSIGAGTGTRALGWKGGIGTASRILPTATGEYRIGVLVQTNFGGVLTISGFPVGRHLDSSSEEARRDDRDGGSVMIVIATDAPLSHLDLRRVAERAFAGIARTGSYMSHGSGDYAVAFTTHRGLAEPLDGSTLTPLFVGVAEATEEAVLNSLFRATTTAGFHGRRSEQLPLGRVIELVRSQRPD